MTPTELHLVDHTPLRILQLSDCHLLERPEQTLMGIDTELSFHTVLEYLLTLPQWPPDLVLLTGDLVQDPYETSYHRLLEIMEDLEVPWVCLPGNHDSPAMMADILCQRRDHCAKRITTSQWQIICLNSYKPDSHTGHLPESELRYLTHTLTMTQKRSALIALHHPPVPVGSAWMDTMQLDNGNEFLDLLSPFPQVKGVIFGHIHQVFSSQHLYIPLWSTPSTCFQFKPGSSEFALDNLSPGWRWLELHANGHIETRVERLDSPPPGLDFSSEGY